MTVQYRHYEKPDDIILQEKFWVEATKNLPWPWKPNKTQEIFSKKDSFDPRSKNFAFDDDKLVGYQSFVDGRDFIALGYPWVLDHPQKIEIQNQLWKRTIEVLDKDFPKLYLLQRFREQWKEHINFFLTKGFSLTNQYPIFVHDISPTYTFEESFPQLTFNVHTGLQEELLRNVLKTKNVDSKKLEQTINSAKYLDYDYSIYIQDTNEPLVYCGTTVRFDASYAEIALFEFNEKKDNSNFITTLALKKIINELAKNNISFVSMTVDEADPIISILKELNFSQRSKSVYVRLDR